MINHDSLIVILYSLPIYQILFYTVQLLSFRRRNPSKKYLGLLLLGMTTFLVLTAIQSLGYFELFSWLFIFHLPVLLSVAPSFFLYILSITRENHDVNKSQRLILFLPAVFVLVLNLVLFTVTSAQERLDFLSAGIIGGGREPGYFPVLMISWITGIALVFFQIIFAVTKLLKIIQTETELMRLQPAHLAYLEWPWIIGISISVMVYMVVNALFGLIWPTSNIAIVVIYSLLMLLSGGLAGYLGMKQDTLLNQVSRIGGGQTAPIIPQSTVDVQAQETSALNQSELIQTDELEALLENLPLFLEKDKPFLKPDFSLHDLCAGLNTSRRKMSYVLNDILGKNFYGLINEYRVKEAQELLRKDEVSQLKIEVLGEMVGFQSKSSFNACFKKYTGMTPSEFKNRGRVQRA